MKGLFITELLELIEAQHGLAAVDRTINGAVPPTDGVYTAMANYDPIELFGLAAAYASDLKQPPATVLRALGRQLFRRLVERNDRLLDRYPTAIRALQDINILITKTRVFSLEPKPPKISFESLSPTAGVLTVHSRFPIQDIVLGALEACIAHYDAPVDIMSCETAGSNDESVFRYDIKPKATSCLTTSN